MSSTGEGSNQSSSASCAFAIASASESPADAQPGNSGNTADQRLAAGSNSTTARNFIHEKHIGTPSAQQARVVGTKNKKEAHLCLVAELVEKLKLYRSARFIPIDRVFPCRIPRASRLKVDAEKNGIDYRDAQGCYVSRAAIHLGNFLAAKWGSRSAGNAVDATQRSEADNAGLYG